MSRRELLLIVAVVVPFLALVILALSVPLGPDAPPPVTASATPPPPPTNPTQPTAPVIVPRAVVLDAGGDEVSPELAAPVKAVTPEILRCFADQRAHLSGVQRLAVGFTPTSDGGFAGVRVPTGGNPYLSACVEDVFEEVHFTPTGLETFRPATHTFVFDPSRE